MLTSRLVSLADVVAVFHRAGGVEAAIAVAKERSGTHFDPALVDLFCQQAPVLLSDLGSASSWETVIAAEPALEVLISGQRLDDALEAMADFTALKSAWTIGHSRSVAELAAEPAVSRVTVRDALRALEAGVLDELQIHQIPVLFGDGRRLFDVLASRVELEIVRVIDTPEATHIRYRIRR